ncbi:hypothetical protein D3C81_1251420 [compost metagenome]
MAEQRLQPREDMHACFIDQAFVSPRQGCTATCLAQLDMAHRTAAHQLFAQLDHAIDHGVLRAPLIQPCAG